MAADLINNPGRCKLFLLLAAVIIIMSITGCLGEAPVNIDWATPAGTIATGNGIGIQETLDIYTSALVEKDRDKFASVLDTDNPTFRTLELQRFDRLIDVPFNRYYLGLISQNETAPGTVAAKVNIAFTLQGSFPALPNPDRIAYLLVKRGESWKLTGDADELVLGKKRDARFEDFGKIEVLNGDRTIIMYQAAQRGVAEQVQRMTEASLPRLEEVIPGDPLPKVPAYVYAGTEEIDQTYPGKWQEWTSGASRQLGEKAEQGGEIIVDSQVFEQTNGSNPGYNQQMLAHELTHVALFPQTGNRTPPFLVEGLADYVAGIEEASLLKDQLRRGIAINPTLRNIYQPGGFSVLLSTEAASLAYEEADTAVALLEQKFGNEKVLALLREFRRRENDKQNQDALVDEVFRSVLGISWIEFENEWLLYVTGA